MYVQKHQRGGFPGGSVIKHPSANSGDMSLIPDPGRSHMLRSNEAPAAQLLSLLAATIEAHAFESPHTTTRQQPCLLQIEKTLSINEDPTQPKINKSMKNY